MKKINDFLKAPLGKLNIIPESININYFRLNGQDRVSIQFSLSSNQDYSFTDEFVIQTAENQDSKEFIVAFAQNLNDINANQVVAIEPDDDTERVSLVLRFQLDPEKAKGREGS